MAASQRVALMGEPYVDKNPGSLETLIAPMPVEDFLSSFWDTCYLHQQHEAGRFEKYFSLRDVDRWLSSNHGEVFVTSPERPGPERFDPREGSASTIYSAFSRGCTLVLEPMDTWPPLVDLVKHLSWRFHADVHARAYLLANGAEPLDVYVAGHDVLILQLAGERVWNLHEPRLQQVNPRQKKTFKFPFSWYGRTKTPIQEQVPLGPGGLLYVPRGVPYQGVDQKGTGLYLLFRITPMFWMDFLKVAAEYVALHSDVLRRALPPGFVEDPEIQEEMRRTFAEAMSAFQELASFDDVLAAVQRNRVKWHGFPSDGHFEQLGELESLTADSKVQRREDLLCTVDEIFDIDKNPRSAIFFGTEQVIGPPKIRRAYEFIRDHDRFLVSEIPGLDATGQLVLARRLIQEGLLRRVRESRNSPEVNRECDARSMKSRRHLSAVMAARGDAPEQRPQP